MQGPLAHHHQRASSRQPASVALERTANRSAIVVLPEDEWLEKESASIARLRPHVMAMRERRAGRRPDAVADFLFDYYGIRGRDLLNWSPGIGVLLHGPGADRFLRRRYFRQTLASEYRGVRPGRDGVESGLSVVPAVRADAESELVGVSPASLPERRRRSIRWIGELLEQTQRRPPFLGCAGMHEWAMIGIDGEIRHRHLPLRYDRAGIADVLASVPVACTHYDAFRFFAPTSRALNRMQPVRSKMPDLEQPGCLHTNMDVLRWALKLSPFVATDILADAFELALAIRRVDMRASPYDLRESGLEPIPVETAEGRSAYRAFQQQFHEAATPIREQLIGVVRQIEATDQPTAGLVGADNGDYARRDNKNDIADVDTLPE